MLIAETLPPAFRTHAFSLRSAAWNIGFAGASFVAGRIIVGAGYAPAFVTYSAFCTLAIAYFSLPFRHHPIAHACIRPGVPMSQQLRSLEPSASRQTFGQFVDQEPRDFEARRRCR